MRADVALIQELQTLFTEEFDYEETEKQALATIAKAESATKTALTMQDKYYSTLKSLQKLSPAMALGTLEALKDLATRCSEAVKGAATAWESAEKAAGITHRVKGQYERARGQYYYSGGEFMLNDTQAATESRVPAKRATLAEQGAAMRAWLQEGAASKTVVLKYRVPGKGGFKTKEFHDEHAAKRWVDKIRAADGDDVEIQWGT